MSGVAYTVVFTVEVADDLAGDMDTAALIAAEMIGEKLVPDAVVIDHEASRLNGEETSEVINLFAAGA